MPTVGLVVARFYDDLAEETEKLAREYAAERGATVERVIDVPGVYDAVLAADRLARLAEIEAVVVLGPVVEGDTDHDEVIAHAVASQLADVSLDRDTPVTFGVTGPGMSAVEARERVEYGAEAVHAALDLHETLPEPA